MDDKTLLGIVTRHIAEYLETDVSHLTLQSRLATEIDGINSLEMYEMMLYLEDCLGVEFDEDIMEKLDTMQDLLDYIKARPAKTDGDPTQRPSA